MGGGVGARQRGVLQESRMLRTSDLEYDLPERFIATRAAEPRESARLMAIDRGSGEVTRHGRVADLPGLLRAGDLLVLNATRVVAARLEGVRADTGGHVEGLFLSEESAGLWTVLLRGKRIREGVEVALASPEGSGGLRLRCERRGPDDEPGSWIVRVMRDDGSAVTSSAAEVLDAVGRTPLPPYIVRARKHSGVEVPEGEDRARYQTVYARGDSAGSVAAPTAGLHLTPDLLKELDSRGVRRAEVVLHVGTGTFRSVDVEEVERHPMHAEWCSMSGGAVEEVVRAKAEGRRVIAVGTTSARTLETYARALEGDLPAGWVVGELVSGEVGGVPRWISTRLLITPGYRWRWVDGLLTNFHLPRSTLMAMVGSLLPGSVGRLKDVYREAMEREYRFYSYGDAMLIVPG